MVFICHSSTIKHYTYQIFFNEDKRIPIYLWYDFWYNHPLYSSYNFHGPDAKVSMYVDGNYFAELVGVNNATKIAVAKTLTPDIALWNTETADSWGGGTHNVTNKYVSGFL